MSICARWVFFSALVPLFPSVAADTTTRGLLSVRPVADSVTGAPRLLGTTAATPTHGWEPDGTWNGKKVAGPGKGDQKNPADFVVPKNDPQGPNLGQAGPSATGFQTSNSEDNTPVIIGGLVGGLVIILGLGMCIFLKCVRANLDPVSPGEAEIGVESYTTGVTHWANTSDKPAPKSVFHKPHHGKGEGAHVDGADLHPSLSGLSGVSQVSGAPLTYDPHVAPSHESGRTLHSASVENSKHHVPQGEHASHKAHSIGHTATRDSKGSHSPGQSPRAKGSHSPGQSPRAKGSHSPGQSPRAENSHHSPRHSLPTPGVGTVHPTHNAHATPGVGQVSPRAKGSHSPGQSPRAVHSHHSPRHSLPTPGVGTVHPTHNTHATPGVGQVHSEPHPAHHAHGAAPHHAHHAHGVEHHHSLPTPGVGTVHPTHKAAADHHAPGPTDSLRSAGHGDAHGAHPHHKPTLS